MCDTCPLNALNCLVDTQIVEVNYCSVDKRTVYTDNKKFYWDTLFDTRCLSFHFKHTWFFKLSSILRYTQTKLNKKIMPSKKIDSSLSEQGKKVCKATAVRCA